ncbi:hypothetical protein AS180_21140 [Priestia veravalensis]|uniref:RiboL-PSP-HEPN domain-containing protein n=1 Tax=Priestia veravalensis TaxID=1414648 RepID=A0A0V8JAF3_9BACI|nr:MULTISPECIES: MAE_28990/MAE_18760 family HEPN-like nuclease [Priestia]KSU83977.1 hypothetical protein AS180_21140 [Priestia veravalensis]SCC59980.1 hypothetical protein GA0061087_11292 [Priestia flexa]
MSSDYLEKLQDKLDKNLSWRKKELTTLKSNIDSSEGAVLNTFIRVGITILYSHWEGFIKMAAREYLNYLNSQRIECQYMTDNFITLLFKSTIVDARESNKSIAHHRITHSLFNHSGRIFKVDAMKKLIVDTEANLSYKVLEDILFSLGLDKTKYELKEHYIKDMMVDDRNKIAHGEYLDLVNSKLPDADKIAKEEFETLYKEILSLVEHFKDQIMDAATKKLYLKTPN